MKKLKMIKLGVVGLLVIVLVLGGIWAVRKGKFFGRADTLGIQAENLTATVPFVADDVSRDYWAYYYIDAVTREGSGRLETENPRKVIMENYIAGQDGTHQGGVYFYPDELMDRRWGVFYLSRALNIQPCFYCMISFVDVSPSDWFAPYMEAMWRGGYLDGYDATHFGPDELASVAMFNKALTRAGYPFTAPPESTYWDFDANSQITKLTRAGAAAMLAYALDLPITPPSVYLQFDFPQSADAGFDFGYEVQRKFQFESEWKRIWVQDPPEEGMEEASDFGMFYDSSISDTSGWEGRWFDYRVYLFNRDGDISAPAEITVYF